MHMLTYISYTQNNMADLINKKILLFYPFGATKHYGDSIKNELIKKGAYVVGYDERPSQHPIVKAVIRVLKKKVPTLFSAYIKKIIRNNRDFNFDYILVLRGEAFTAETVSLLKTAYKNAKLILYLWDILKSTKLEDVIPFFDKALSFDPDDVKNNSGLILRPTFFMPQYEMLKKHAIKKYDIVFIGTLHSNRYQTLQILKDYLEKNSLSYLFYLYVPSKLAYIKNKYLDGIPVNEEEIHYDPISLDKTLDIIANTKCILDLNFTGQKSLSMRAFESMISKTKYITTNPEIKSYDFYSEKNILLIDINDITIPNEFINSPFEDVPYSILEKYSVRQLVDDLLS